MNDEILMHAELVFHAVIKDMQSTINVALPKMGERERARAITLLTLGAVAGALAPMLVLTDQGPDSPEVQEIAMEIFDAAFEKAKDTAMKAKVAKKEG